ncbi:hypothetical protein EK21DRAFT_92006 [Setomelanomma holmii]|uniref:Uncharacterized protein n=1 Tax=Setomelanomma holmii TaxID=210430 RepID=A0A9P4LHJ5_9PLEO|nr:hypothetical protein EK21DRAFT_92006 [Setomelanomma holmii]
MLTLQIFLFMITFPVLLIPTSCSHVRLHFNTAMYTPSSHMSLAQEYSIPFDTYYATGIVGMSGLSAQSEQQSPRLATTSPSPATTSAVVTKPEYTCPPDIGTFYCEDCGGGKDLVPYISDQDPNGACVGLENGMYEGCECFDEPKSMLLLLERPDKTWEWQEFDSGASRRGSMF